MHGCHLAKASELRCGNSTDCLGLKLVQQVDHAQVESDASV